MSETPEPRFVLHRVTQSEWIIHDLRYPQDDHRRVVACVYEVAETESEVVWMRDLPLATRYSSPFEVLEEVERIQGTTRATRPIMIPHLPPLMAT